MVLREHVTLCLLRHRHYITFVALIKIIIINKCNEMYMFNNCAPSTNVSAVRLQQRLVLTIAAILLRICWK